jgi:hypothetical protein
MSAPNPAGLSPHCDYPPRDAWRFFSRTLAARTNALRIGWEIGKLRVAVWARTVWSGYMLGNPLRTTYLKVR